MRGLSAEVVAPAPLSDSNLGEGRASLRPIVAPPAGTCQFALKTQYAPLLRVVQQWPIS
jgi:hypothetical protein